MTDNTTITLYHANWCGHCRRFLPVWEDLKRELDKIGIEHREYEEGQNPEMIKEANISGFPTLRINKGKEYDYKGPRTVDAIIAELTDREGPVQAGGNRLNLSDSLDYSSSCSIDSPNNSRGGGNPYGMDDGDLDDSDSYDEDYYRMKYMKYKAKYFKVRGKLMN